MKKWMILFIPIAALAMGAMLTTRTSEYKTFHSIADIDTPDIDLAVATGFNIAVPAGAINLTKAQSHDSQANAVSLIVHATAADDADTVTQKIYGVSVAGAPQLIASVVWTIGLARADGTTATFLWAEHAVVTDYHTTTIAVGGTPGGDGVGCISFDATGFQYIYGLWTADSGDPDIVTCLYRHY